MCMRCGKGGRGEGKYQFINRIRADGVDEVDGELKEEDYE